MRGVRAHGICRASKAKNSRVHNQTSQVSVKCSLLPLGGFIGVTSSGAPCLNFLLQFCHYKPNHVFAVLQFCCSFAIISLIMFLQCCIVEVRIVVVI